MDSSRLFEVSRVYHPEPVAPSETQDEALEPVRLDVMGLTYVVKERVGSWWKGACFRPIRQKTVLKDVTMSLETGKLTAIVGSSGSGKTSLLDVVSCRADGLVNGKLYFRNHACTKELMKKHASYVMQADRLLPNLTVRETLRYTAYLKLPGDTKKEEVEAKVQQVLKDMGLRPVADSRIGGAVIRGISGGEKRRVTIAIQLLQDPDILLLDEPTSGLDAYTARYLVSNLADLAHRGKIVLLTIHQPRSDIFKLLDQVALLTLGEMAYFGKGENLVPFFTRIGFPCPKYANPLDRYIDVASIDRRNAEKEQSSMEQVRKIVSSYKQSDLHRDMAEKVKETLRRTALIAIDNYQAPRRPGWLRVFTTVLHRMNSNLSRDRMNLVGRMTAFPVFVIFIVIFLGRLKHNQESVQDRTGLMYQSMTVPPYVAIVNCVALFPSVREVFYRECRDGLYSAATFLAAYAAHILPFCMVASFLFACMLYWICGLNPEPDRFAMYMAVVFILHFLGELLTVGLMGIFLSPQLANSSAGLIVTATTLISSGIIRTIQNMPEVLQYLGYSAIQKYATEILVVNEYQGLNLTCDQGSKSSPCIFPNGTTYLEMFFPGAIDHIARNFSVICGFAGGTFIAAFLAFKLRGVPNLH